jgi:hypothetical protein
MITPLLSWRPTLGELLSARYCASVGFFRASNALALITSFDVRFSAADANGRTIWIVDAQRDGKHFVVRADEKLTAFLELEAAIRAATQIP